MVSLNLSWPNFSWLSSVFAGQFENNINTVLFVFMVRRFWIAQSLSKLSSLLCSEVSKGRISPLRVTVPKPKPPIKLWIYYMQYFTMKTVRYLRNVHTLIFFSNTSHFSCNEFTSMFYERSLSQCTYLIGWGKEKIDFVLMLKVTPNRSPEKKKDWKALHSYKSWIFVDRVEFCT